MLHNFIRGDTKEDTVKDDSAKEKKMLMIKLQPD